MMSSRYTSDLAWSLSSADEFQVERGTTSGYVHVPDTFVPQQLPPEHPEP